MGADCKTGAEVGWDGGDVDDVGELAASENWKAWLSGGNLDFRPCIIVFLRGERDFVAHMTGALKGRRSAHGSQRLCMSS